VPDEQLATVLAGINKQYGKGTIMRLGDEDREPVAVTPTGSIALNEALGIGGLPRGGIVEAYGPESSGKALALDTLIPTPKGWTTMGELSVGDEVFAADGSPARVSFATPVMYGHDCYLVRFSDGAEIVADADHQWVTQTDAERRRRQYGQVRTTEAIAVMLRTGRQANHAIPTAAPFRLPDADLPFDPYLLGLWLGDGSKWGDVITTADPEILTAFEDAAFPVTPHGKRYNYYIKGLKRALKPLDVIGNKHIPAAYLRASEAQRRALLAGLLDTDGSVRAGAGLIRFVNTNPDLIKGVRELVHSLGLKTTTDMRPAGIHGARQDCWTVHFTPDQAAGEFFCLSRKRGRRSLPDSGRARLRYITAVEPVPSVPVRCIQVDDPEHLYLAGQACIPTHNTSIALHAAAQAQRLGKVAFIDAEHAFDPEWAAVLGVDTDELLINQPDTGEQGLEIADRLLAARLPLIIIDSVSALVPKAEIDGEMGDAHVGLQARLMSQALRKMAGRARAAGTTVFFINQLREKVGVMFGPTETTSGGKALKFYASIRLDVRRIETLKDGTDDIGYRCRVKVVKNKCARPHRRAEFDFLYGEGIARGHELIDLGAERGVVRKSGAWYTYNGVQLGQGKAKAAQHLRENPAVAERIELEIFAAGFPGAVVLPPGGKPAGTHEEVLDGEPDQAASGNPRVVRISG